MDDFFIFVKIKSRINEKYCPIPAAFGYYINLCSKREKVKGSKVVTTSVKEVGSFDALEVDDNLEVYLEKGEKTKLKLKLMIIFMRLSQWI